MELSRRKFLEITAASAAASTLPMAKVAGKSPTPRNKTANPLVVASANGLPGVAVAYKKMAEDNADPLEAAIAGVNLQELDPNDQGVGLGGFPNELGVVQLDASCMHGPSKRAGAVGALEGIATPSLVAKAVMEHTDHIFLVGQGAKQFALKMGFKEQDLLTEKSRQAWLDWRRTLNPGDNWLDPDDDRFIQQSAGTINMCALDAKGDIGSVTTTSGLSWKIPGRVGDSPIIGAGQYCDNTVGAAGSTGRGEANIKVCGAFFVVEMMRRGMHPREACLEALKRTIEMTESRLLDEQGRPTFYVNFYALSKDGKHGGATFYGPSAAQRPRSYGTYAVADDQGSRLEKLYYLFEDYERPRKMMF